MVVRRKKPQQPPAVKSPPKAPKPIAGAKSSRKNRIEEDQVVYDIKFTTEPYAEYKTFQELIACLYGPTGIGKTTFAFNIPGCHILATENPNNPNEYAHTRIPNWPTFKAFVTKVESEPALFKGISMFAIDTIEFLVSKCMSTVCYDWGLTDLSEEGFSRAWVELKEELTYNLLRLNECGFGLLLISHERQRDSISRRMTLKKDSMDLSNSINNAISFLSSCIMHMRYVDKSKTSAELGHMRCISITGSEEEEAKDNTCLLQKAANEDGIIKFRKESDAVKKILSCFDK